MNCVLRYSLSKFDIIHRPRATKLNKRKAAHSFSARCIR